MTVLEPRDIRVHLEKAVYLARTGRPGPVWLDIPLDVQAATVEANTLEGFTASTNESHTSGDELRQFVSDLIERFNQVGTATFDDWQRSAIVRRRDRIA